MKLYNFLGTLGRLLRPVSVGRLISIYTGFNLIAFGGPLFLLAKELLVEATFFNAVLSYVLILLLLVFLQVTTFAALTFVSVRLMKLVGVVLLLINAGAFYFIVAYGVHIDMIIVLNVFAVDTKTTIDLLHPLLFVTIALLGVIPSVLLMAWPVRNEGWKLRIIQPLVVTIAFLGFAFATSFNWLWIDRNAPRLSGLVLPWSYVVHTTKYVRAKIRMNREQDLLPDGRLTDLAQGVSREVVVLVIGESERAANNAYYGYKRETNPYTKNLGIIAVSDARSCATYTLAGLACMLTADGSEASVNTNEEPLGSYLSRMGVDVIWRTNSSGEPRQEVNEYIRLRDLVDDCSKEYCDALPFELALLSGLESRVKGSASQRIFIVMHLGRGSHGPTYNEQIPSGFAIFEPVCETVQIRECSYQELVNAYDNTVAYTDYFLAEMIAFLGKLGDADAALIYVSDHGESLGESGVYLHGLPSAVAPAVQLDIPLLIWMSDGFAERRGVSEASIQATLAHGHDNIFHSVIGAFGVDTPVYRPEYDLFAAHPFE